MHGACLKGDACQFSHDWRDQENNICTFYQRGFCSYGSHCRYEHVKIKHPQSVDLPAYSASTGVSADVGSSQSVLWKQELTPNSGKGFKVSKQPSALPLTTAWTLTTSKQSVESDVEPIGLGFSSGDPSEEPICALAATGRCTLGDSCPHLHGDLCLTCGKHCLHPFRPDEREEHQRQCERNQKRLEALRSSQEIECSICLERVLSKPTVAERKFGLLSGCDHPFCISCIRDWRSNTHAPGMDVDTVVRACPVCRVVSHYVIPSVIWYSNPEEKQEIVDGYKSKLSGIDCRHFDFGNGSCPFGTSCFYKHVYKDGTREETKLRHLGAADGGTVIAKDVRLSDFLGRLNIRR